MRKFHDLSVGEWSALEIVVPIRAEQVTNQFVFADRKFVSWRQRNGVVIAIEQPAGHAVILNPAANLEGDGTIREAVLAYRR